MEWNPDDLAPLGPRGARLAYVVETALMEGRTRDAARTLTDAGDGLAALGLATPTQRVFEAALRLAEEARARRLEADLAWRLGQVAEALRRPAEAASRYERAVARFAGEGALDDQATALLAEARCRLAVEGPSIAQRLLQEAVDLARRSPDRALLGAAMEQSAEAASAISDPAGAAARYREAARLYRDLGDDPGLIRATIGLAECHLDDGEHVQAVHVLAPIEPQLDGGLDDAVAGRGLALLARVYLHAGDEEQAAEHFGRALELLERAGDDHRRAGLMLAFGRRFLDTGGSSGAADMLRMALSLYERAGDQFRIAPAAYSLARCHFEAGALVRADEAIDRALDVVTRMGDVEGLELCTQLAVRIAVAMGQGKMALDRLKLAARVKAELGDYRGEVRYLLGALGASLAIPDLDSMALADEFIEALRRTGTAFLGPQEIDGIAEDLGNAGRPDYAREIMLLQARAELELSRPSRAVRAFGMAGTYAYRAELRDEARDLWDQAISVGLEHSLEAEVHEWRINRDVLGD